MGDTYKSRVVDDLANGKTISPGETFKLNAEEQKLQHNKRLIEEDRIFKVETAPTKPPTPIVVNKSNGGNS